MSETLTVTREDVSLDVPWNIVLHNDPVSIGRYVTMVLAKVFGYPQGKAHALMNEAHTRGSSVVWTGDKERAEFYTQQLQTHQLKISMEKAG